MFTPLPGIHYPGTPLSTCSLDAENSEQAWRTKDFKQQEFTTTLVSSLHSDHSLNTIITRSSAYSRESSHLTSCKHTAQISK